ncbi:hypothetical protein HXY33_01515 [Candidatus Bathyarchaeota archaeon]|nr:hypothetical protein [Candidatus Bathyarchaeota archaeon]
MKILIKYLALTMVLLFSLSLLCIRPATAELSSDINGDGYVNVKDAVILGAAFGSQSGDTNWNPNADLNEDGFVNAQDAMILLSNFGPVL